MGMLSKYRPSSPVSPSKACNLRRWQTSAADSRGFHFETPSLANHSSLPLVLTSRLCAHCNSSASFYAPLFMHTYWCFAPSIIPILCHLPWIIHSDSGTGAATVLSLFHFGPVYSAALQQLHLYSWQMWHSSLGWEVLCSWGRMRKHSTAPGSHDRGLILCNICWLLQACIQQQPGLHLTFTAGKLWRNEQTPVTSPARTPTAITQSDSSHFTLCSFMPSVKHCHVTV